MAIARMHNSSSFGHFWDESPHGQPTPRASKLLQMWRELECEHDKNQFFRLRRCSNASDSECISTLTSLGHGSDNGGDYVSQHSDGSLTQEYIDSEMDHEENGSIESEHSADIGGIEKGRVRQVFQEWMNGGSKGPSSCGFNLNNHTGQWLGENECERVRIIREWVQMTAQERNNCESVRETEFGTQIEQALDGLVLNSRKHAARRPIRRLCGRQTLLDLLSRGQSERKRELLGLSEQKPVSKFAHRNRIQSHLKARFLRNVSLVPVGKTLSGAATELGLLRLRHTVSDLREEFLSKLGNSASASINVGESVSSSSGINGKDAEPASRDREVTGIPTASSLENPTERARSLQELELVTDSRGLDNKGREHEVTHCGVESARDIEAQQLEEFSDVQYNGPSEQVNSIMQNEPSVEAMEANVGGLVEVCNENGLVNNSHSNILEVGDSVRNFEVNAGEEFDSRNSLSQVEAYRQLVTEVHDYDQEQFNVVAPTGHVGRRVEEGSRSLIDNTGIHCSRQLSHRNIEERHHLDEDWTRQNFEDAVEGWLDMPSGGVIRSLQEDTASQWSPETSHRYVDEQNWVQESNDKWPVHNFQGSFHGWPDMPSRGIVGTVERIDSFYFHDDGNARDMELRELVSRGRVSSLLRSDFRQSLDRVLQSHAERLAHASDDWEHDQEQLNDRDQFVGTSFLAESHPLWDVELQSISNQQLGTEREVINDLRIDMARLQQRMDKMQNMLESCMDMQVELQRSVHQEVSAALNRSVTFPDANESEEKQIHNESQWNHVKNGICCLCCDNTIDSLLYRCGHMCACSKCSKSLVRQRGKCPLCEAPVIEAVRAYFVQ